MQIVLPEKAAGKPVFVHEYAHPRSGRLAKFITCDGVLYELTRVGSKTRSILVGNSLHKDGSICVAMPIHPKFLIIRTLFERRDRALPLDILLELGAADGADCIPPELAEPHAAAICDVDAGMYRLNEAQLEQFLDRCVECIGPSIPAELREQVLRCVQPIDPRETPARELVDDASKYAAVTFVATSWLHPSVAEWYLAKHDFSRLEAAALELHRLHIEASAHQFSQLAYQPVAAGKASSTPVAKPAASRKKRALPTATKNKSLLDMFQPRAAKKSRSGP